MTITIISPNLESARAWTMNGARSGDITGVAVTLDCRRATLSIDLEYGAGVGIGTDDDTAHGHIRRYPASALSNDAAMALLERLAPLAERVVDGYTSEWDGHNNVAVLDDDALEADAEMEDAAGQAADEGTDDALIVTSIDNTGDWRMAAEEALLASSTDADCDAAAAEYVESLADLFGPGPLVIPDAADAFRGFRDELRAEVEREAEFDADDDAA